MENKNYDKYCSVCGNKVYSGNLICSYCGNVVVDNLDMKTKKNDDKHNNELVDKNIELSKKNDVLVVDDSMNNNKIKDGKKLSIASLILFCMFPLAMFLCFLFAFLFKINEDFLLFYAFGFFIFVYIGFIPTVISLVLGIISIFKYYKLNQNIDKTRRVLNILNIITVIFMVVYLIGYFCMWYIMGRFS